MDKCLLLDTSTHSIASMHNCLSLHSMHRCKWNNVWLVCEAGGRKRRGEVIKNTPTTFETAQWWKVAVTPSIRLQWWNGVAFWKAESKLYRCRHYSASLEHLLRKESVKNGSRKWPTACKSRPQRQFQPKYQNLTKIAIWQPLESSFQDESIGTIIIKVIDAAPLPAVESQLQTTLMQRDLEWQ